MAMGRFIALVGVLACGAELLVFHAADLRGNPTGDAQLRQVLLEAARAAKDNLQSGSGVGRHCIYRKEKRDANFVLVRKARVETRFRKDRYYVKLAYDINKDFPYTKGILIEEGTNSYGSAFGPAFRKTNCRAEAYLDVQARSRAALDLPWHLNKLSDAVTFWLRPDNEMPSLRLTREGAHRIVGGYVDGITKCALEADARAGYNVTKITVWNRGDQHPVRKFEIGWARGNGVWYVQRYRQHDRYPADGEEIRLELDYDKFEPNVEVPLDSFALRRLEAPDGTPMFVHRKNRPVEVVPFSTKALTNQAQLDEVIEQGRQELAASRNGQNGWNRVWTNWRFLVANSALVIGLGGVYFARCKLRRGRESVPPR